MEAQRDSHCFARQNYGFAGDPLLKALHALD